MTMTSDYRPCERIVGQGRFSESANFAPDGQKEPRHVDPRRGLSGRYRSRGSHRAMWVAPSSAGRSSLTSRARTQFGPNSGAPILRFR